MQATLLASLMLAAVPFVPAAGTHSQHARVTSSVVVIHSCSVSVSDQHRVELRGDCDDRNDRDDETSARSLFVGDQDNRPIYRIDRDDATGVTTIQF